MRFYALEMKSLEIGENAMKLRKLHITVRDVEMECKSPLSGGIILCLQGRNKVKRNIIV